MNIGEEIRRLKVEPLELPVPLQEPEPERKQTPTEKPEKEPVGV